MTILAAAGAACVQLAKDNPILTTGGILVSIALGAIAFDSYYAHAADLKQMSQTVNTQLEINRLSGEVAFLQSRRSTLEDKIFEATQRIARDQPKPNPVDTAIQQRYQIELRDVIRQQQEKSALIDRLRTGR